MMILLYLQIVYKHRIKITIYVTSETRWVVKLYTYRFNKLSFIQIIDEVTTMILVTGAAGFIGSNLVDSLLTDGHQVVGIDNFDPFYERTIKENNLSKARLHQNFKFYECDILNRDSLETLFHQHSIHSVIHLAAKAGVRPSIEDPMGYFKVNIDGTLSILECCKKYTVNRLLFASSSSVYGNNHKVPFSEKDPVDHPVSPYAATKKAGELLCYTYHHLYQIPIACLRFFTVYGPRQRPEMAIHKFTRMIYHKQPIPVFNEGLCKRDYTYIDDIIQGIKAVLTTPQLTYDVINLGGDRTISTLDLIKKIEITLQKSAELNLLPAQPGDVEQTNADLSHARKNYLYKPNFPIDKGIQLFVEWFLKKHG